jgi:hypothetical protein
MQNSNRVPKVLLNHWAKHAAHRAIARLVQIHDTAQSPPSQDVVLTSVATEITSALQAHVDRNRAAGQLTNQHPAAHLLRELMEDPKVVAALTPETRRRVDEAIASPANPFAALYVKPQTVLPV